MNAFIRFLAWMVCAAGVSSGFAAEFRALSWQGSIADVTYVGQPRGEKFSISSVSLGPWRKISPLAEGVEFRQGGAVATASASGANGGSSTPLARVVWPEGVSRALLLFVPAAAGAPLPYQVIVIPERAESATPAALRLFNYSGASVAVRLGEAAPSTLEPRGMLESDARPASGSQALKIAYREGTDWKMAADTAVALPAGFSVYVFVRSLPRFELEPNNATVGYKLIYDRLKLPAPAAGN